MSDTKITNDQYALVAQKFIACKLKQFEEAGGWEVVNEKAQHCTYKRYLEAGIADCENTGKLIENLKSVLEAVREELLAKIACLEARQSQRSNFNRMAEIISEAVKETENISENWARTTNASDNLTLESRKEEKSVDATCLSYASAQEASVAEVSISADTSTNDESGILKEVQRKSTKPLMRKLIRPPTSLTGSFTIDQDEDTIAFPEPMRPLTFDDTTMVYDEETTPQAKNNFDVVENSSKKENGVSIRSSKPPVLKSELAKQWIREVTRKKF